MATAANTTIHVATEQGTVTLEVGRAAIQKVLVSGTDLVLVLADGRQFVLRDLAMRLMTQADLKVVFADATVPASELLAKVGKVSFGEMVTLGQKVPSSQAPAPTEPAASPAPPAPPAETRGTATDPADLPAPPAPGVEQVSTAAASTREASYDAPPSPPPPLQVQQGRYSAPPATPGAAPQPVNPPPPPPPPPETIGIGLQWFNVTGQTVGTQDGRMTITGAGGSARSAADFSAEAQAERELIEGSGGDDLIVGDSSALLGSGFARQLSIQLSANGKLEVDSLVLQGVPAGISIDGAAPLGDGWKVELPPDFAAGGYRLTLVLRYAVAPDGAGFSPQAFDIGITARGKLDGSPIEGVRVLPAILRDVNGAADMSYSANGREGLVLAAFGLGDDIRAGAGNDEVRAGVGHDRVLGEGGNDTLDGGAGNDLLIGGTGADRLFGDTGRDTASYAGSADAVQVDLAAGTATGGDAEGDSLSGIEDLVGSEGADELAGDAASNRLEGLGGDDRLLGRAGADILDGGAGTDRVSYDGSTAGVTVNLALGTGQGGDADGDSLAGIESVTGSASSDQLTGDAAANVLEGAAGDDVLDGAAGADRLLGDAGTDTARYAASSAGVQVSLGTGKGTGGDAEGDRLQDIENLSGSRHADELTGDAGVNRLAGEAGDDLLEGMGGADELIGGEGTDTASYVQARQGVSASLEQPASNTGDAAGDRFEGIENLEGSEHDDQLAGDAQANRLMGAPGADQLSGLAGDDVLDGGAGADALDGGEGVDTAIYSFATEGVRVSLGTGLGQGGDAEGDTLRSVENLRGGRYGDRLAGDAGDNVLDGARGNDVLTGGAGADQLLGGDGSDTADYSGSAAAVRLDLALGSNENGDAAGDVLESIENLAGSAGDDRLAGDSGANTLEGAAGHDVLEGRGGNDVLDGGEGDDLLSGGSGGDVLRGGGGTDTVSYVEAGEGVTVNLATGRGLGSDAEGDLLSGLENALGGAYDDRLVGTAESNLLDGGRGDDSLEGGAGADLLRGGEGVDVASYLLSAAGVTVHLADPVRNTGDAAGDVFESIEGLGGSAFADALYGDGSDNRLDGSSGDDLLSGGEGADRLVGGAGLDTASYAASALAVQVDLRTGTGRGGQAEGDSLQGVENLQGSALDDVLLGDAEANVLEGGRGNDVLEGLGAGDLLDGGSGSDTASYAGAGEGVVASLANAGLNAGEAAGDVFVDIEHLSGSAFADQLVGDAQDNRLDGGDGDDLLQGGLGADVLVGGLGADTASYAAAGAGLNVSLAAPDQNSGEAGGDSFVGIENLQGSAFDDVLSGNEAANRLGGGGGQDLLLGGLGADTLDGGSGIDTVSYAASAAGVVVNLRAGTGAGGHAQGDRLSAVENLVGTAQDDQLIGASGSNRFEGGEGHDLLDGADGADVLLGGLGDDTYVVDHAGDAVTELAGEGLDTVRATISWTLGTNLENLVLEGTDAIDGTGNSVANLVQGNAADNRLDGGGGADRLLGGGGNDSYAVDHAADEVVEDDGAGTDTVVAGIGWRLGDNLENLALTGADDLQATGNTLANQITGNAGANLIDGGTGADRMAGAAGDDIYIVDHANDQVVEVAGDGIDLVRASVSHVLASQVEKLELTGAASINGSGNSLANTIAGNSGNNQLDGGLGADLMTGGQGHDTYVVDHVGDRIVELAGEGDDTVIASITYTLQDQVENLELIGSENLDGTGNALDNRLSGNDGDNLLDGRAGADILAGGAGNDSYAVDDAADQVVEDASNGIDTVRATVSHSLAAHVENLEIVGTGSLNGTGNDLANALIGNAANNRLDGGRGADRLVGNAGDDTYVLDNAGDTVQEAADEGTDRVIASVQVELALNVENVQLTGTADLSIIANGLDNELVGNAGANLIDGGAGRDAMSGGAGDDTYRVDHAGDTVTENPGEGFDLVRSSVSHVLADNVDALELLGSADLLGTGNALDNRLVGNSGANILVGGEGADSLSGMDGDDTYVVDNPLDTVTEAAGTGGGHDLVRSSVGWQLGAFVEDLELTGTADVDGTGNALANVLTGNAGANVLDGGQGDDQMAGGAGDDTYRVDTAGDTVTELAAQGSDTVRTRIDYTLGAQLENLVAEDGLALNLTGNALDNRITGNAEANVLDGLAGADTLVGGAGDDRYEVDDVGDLIVEAEGEGLDEVRASVSYTLSADVENLTLAGTDHLSGTGNALDNLLQGNRGDNLLDGGAGIDVMIGGQGNDTYVVDHANDAAVESPGEGTDLVRAAVGWTLAAPFENLTLTGLADVDGTGHAGNNIIEGNAGANVLTGGGGNDVLRGGGGDDTLVFASKSWVQADGGAGVDTLRLDGQDVQTLGELLGRTTDIEVLDFAGGLGNSDLVAISASHVNAAGFVGGDGAGRLEIVLDGASTGNDALVLDSNEYQFVTDTDAAPDVTLANGATGKLLASKTGGLDLAIDFGTLVLPTAEELVNVWGRVADPSFSGIGSLRTWLDATDIDGDGRAEGLSETGLSNIALNSATLGTWVDKSGAANAFVQTTATARPTLTLGVMNSLPVVRFDGNDTLLSSQPFTASYTVFVVGQMSYSTGAPGAQNGRLVSSSTNNWLMGWHSGQENRFHPEGWNALYSVPAQGGVSQLYTATGNNGTGLFWDNGVQIGGGQPSGSGAGTGAGTLGLLQLGAYAGNARSEASKGDVSEVLVYDRALNDGERRVVEAYLRAKWGVDGASGAVSVGPLGTVALDRTWTGARLLYGTPGADTITVTYTLANVRGTGRVDSVVFGGAGNDTLNGNVRVDALYGGDGNDVLDGKAGADWMAGGAGNDSYTVDDELDTVVETAGGGTDTVTTTANYALGDHVENLVLSGDVFNGSGVLVTARNINGTGNALNNTITGTNGANRIDGGPGVDTMNGGAGNDVYFVDNAGDVIVDAAGTDTVMATSNYVLPTGLENLTFIGTGDVSGVGNAAANVLTVSRFGGQATIQGGLGNDTYVIDQPSDGAVRWDHVFTENAGEGTDTLKVIRSSAVGGAATVTLLPNVEILDLTQAYRTHGAGSAGSDTLWGPSSVSAGNYTWDGGNATTLSGAAGNDTYHVQTPHTQIVENLGGGTDTQVAWVSLRLQNNLENISAANTGGTGGSWRDMSIAVTGNALDNTVRGNWSSNRLEGAEGADTMIGERGDDTYVVDVAGDVVTESANQGIDTVLTALASYTLGAQVENLLFTGDVAHTGTGNALNNAIAGRAAADTLSGGDGHDMLQGNGGADVLQGGNGNDKLMSMRPSFLPATSSGLLLEGWTNTARYGAPVYTATGQGAPNFVSVAGETFPGGPVDYIGMRWSGRLDIATAGSYSFQLRGNDWIRLLIDGVEVGRVTGTTWGTSPTLALAAGAHDILVETHSGTGAATAQVTWRTPGSGSYVALPTSVLSYGETVAPDGAGDTLNGGANDDWLQGADGTDTLVGGTGNDTYIVSAGGDTLTELAGEGTDTVQSDVSFSLAGLEIENLVLTGTGGISGTGHAGANTIVGNAGINVIDGDAGDDTLVGNGGADTLRGGDGHDVLRADGGSRLEGGAGNDTLSLVGAWTPRALTNLALWLDAADLDGDHVQEGLGESGLALGNQVQVWRDKSGNGRDAAQTATENQPLLVLASQNGLPVVRFDGMGDGLNVRNLPTLSGNTNSLFWVMNTTSNLNMPLHTADQRWMLIGENGGGSTDVVQSGSTHSAASFEVDGIAAAFTTRGSVHSKIAGTHTIASLNQPFNFNGSLVMGNGYWSAGYYSAEDRANWFLRAGIPELLVTTGGALTTAQEQLIEGYLAWKWGTQSQLDAAHPYKSAAPTLAAVVGGTLLGGDGQDSLTGGAGADVLDGGTGNDTMAGGAGDDRYTVDSAADTVTELALQGIDTVETALSFTLTAQVENLVLTGTAPVAGTGNGLDNVITGNEADNTLSGGDGNDVLDGGAGNDNLVGGDGDDRYLLDNPADTVLEQANEGFDSVEAAFSLALMSQVEGLRLLGTADLSGTGNALDNAIEGNAGANLLDGGAGSDTLSGGGGNDTYRIDDAADVVIEAASSGDDTVISSVSYSLSANVERLVLTGGATLGAGNAADNTLGGTAADNTLDGGGGTDQMTGGAGNDIYVVDRSSDVVVEGAGEGVDTVQAAGTAWYTLPAQVENLVALASNTGNTEFVGNSLNNEMTGGSGNNRLRGFGGNDLLDGGAGADRLEGGTGDDLYVVDHLSDLVVELAGEGTDRVRASVSFTLASNVEELELLGPAAIDGTGNSLANRLIGNAGANVLDGGAGIDTLSGGLGDDTYVVDHASDSLVEIAGEGIDTVRSALAWTLAEAFENLELTGSAPVSGQGNDADNRLTGNDADNVLDGGAGNDRLDGGRGADTLTGGLGDDSYAVDQAGDDVIETAGEGQDTVQASVSWTLQDHVEQLALTGMDDIDGSGNALDNRITGNAGHNVLDGGAGADTLAGGLGNDTYLVDDLGDVVVEAAGGGTDRVRTTIGLTLAEQVEELELLGVADIDGTGQDLANRLQGNLGRNRLDGLDGDDTLLGAGGNDELNGGEGQDLLDGGAGADTMAGGAGNDVYVVDEAGDAVLESPGEGTDAVRASLSWTLGAECENLELEGAADLSGTGNALDNAIGGNSGDNVLDGGGGSDTLAGGDGNDTYQLDEAGDTVVELAGHGTDTLVAGFSVTLGDHVENLQLTGAAAINGTGNALDNRITGNAGNNLLDGGAGADQMIGGGGNDSYRVDDAGDTVLELAGEGVDTVQATASHTLSDQVENLTLTGAFAIDGTGNAGSNTLVGNGAANVLRGGGGVDTVVAGGGNDRIVLAQPGEVGTVDGGSGDDWLQFTAPGLAVDLRALVGPVQNIEGVQLADGAAGTALTLDALSVASLADARNALQVQLDNGDTLTITSTYVETSRVTAPDGAVTASYGLYTGTDTSLPPSSTLNVYWLAPGAPPPPG